MAIIPSTDKFFSHSENVNTTIGGPASAQEASHWYTMQDVIDTVGGGGGTYQLFTALLTQSGGDNPDSIGGNGGTLDKGYTYEIVTNPDNYDLTIYGAPNNNAGTSFICTVTVPTLPYTSSLELSVNYGAPRAIILENTIGDVYFTYYVNGVYKCNSNNLFGDEKTFVTISNPNAAYTGTPGVCDTTVSLDSIDIKTYDSSFINQNDQLYLNSFEIRVYN